MTSIPLNLLDVTHYDGEGYLPLIDFGAWRVAVLRYIDELEPDRLESMQRHDETDEVFVLLSGRCMLFVAEEHGEASENGEMGTIHGVEMEPLKLYNVKRGTWHTHTLDRDATVLIVENVDTVSANSPQKPLSVQQRRRIVELAVGF
jgi:ureidoglycolate hydrolase